MSEAKMDYAPTPETLGVLLNRMVGAAFRRDMGAVRDYAIEGDAHAESWEAERRAHLALAAACVAYDVAIESCANDPKKMSSFCTAGGDDLDSLYFAWRDLALAVTSEEQP